MSNNKDELAELKARVAELERAAKPAEPFVPEPYQRYDPTARMSMPRSALQEMVNAVPDDVMRGVLRDNRAPQGRPGVIPSSTQVTGDRARAPVNVPGSGTGWAESAPLSPPPGINYVDAQLIADDVRQRMGKK